MAAAIIARFQEFLGKETKESVFIVSTSWEKILSTTSMVSFLGSGCCSIVCDDNGVLVSALPVLGE